MQRLGRATDRRLLPGRKLAGDYAQFAQTCQDSASGIVDACGPGSPDSHRVVWGLTSRPPVSPAGFPPVSRLPAGFSPFARLPLVSLRPAFSGSSPSAVARFRSPFGAPPGSLPLSNLHDSAAAGRFRRRWSRAARAKVTSPAAILQGPACPVPGLPGSRSAGGGPAVPGPPSRVAHRVSPAVSRPVADACRDRLRARCERQRSAARGRSRIASLTSSASCSRAAWAAATVRARCRFPPIRKGRRRWRGLPGDRRRVRDVRREDHRPSNIPLRV